MKLTNLIALPFAMVADAVTLGHANATKRVFYNDECEQVKDLLKAIAETGKSNDRTK